MRAHFDRHNILTEHNHGFRSKHSCESQLLVTTHDLLTRMDRKQDVDVLVLDFSKAFDTVPHQRLLQKLQLLGIHGRIHDWIRSFLTSRLQSIVIDGNRSQEDTVLSGVPPRHGIVTITVPLPYQRPTERRGPTDSCTTVRR